MNKARMCVMNMARKHVMNKARMCYEHGQKT